MEYKIQDAVIHYEVIGEGKPIIMIHGIYVDLELMKGGMEPKPTLILTSRQDDVVGYKAAYDMLEGFPRATFAIIDGAGHNLQIEQVNTFNMLTREWLKRVEESQ